jgi:hypothetical protein
MVGCLAGGLQRQGEHVVPTTHMTALLVPACILVLAAAVHARHLCTGTCLTCQPAGGLNRLMMPGLAGRHMSVSRWWASHYSAYIASTYAEHVSTTATHLRACTAGPRQLLVENYFAASTTLPAEYWMGIMREGSSNPYMYTSGQLVATNVSASAQRRAHSGSICLTAGASVSVALMLGLDYMGLTSSVRGHACMASLLHAGLQPAGRQVLRCLTAAC